MQALQSYKSGQSEWRAGCLKGANSLCNIVPKDGSNIAIWQNALTLNQIAKSSSVAYDMLKFGWLGSTASTIWATTKNAQIEKPSDIFSKDVIIGTSSGSTAVIPSILNSLAKTRFRGVKGYDAAQCGGRRSCLDRDVDRHQLADTIPASQHGCPRRSAGDQEKRRCGAAIKRGPVAGYLTSDLRAPCRRWRQVWP
jgi:hypothetical protein